VLSLLADDFRYSMAENLSLAKVLQANPEPMQHVKNGSLNANGDYERVMGCAAEFESPNRADQVTGAAKTSWRYRFAWRSYC